MANVTTASIITIIRGLIKDTQQADGQDVFEYDVNSGTSFKLSSSRVDSTSIIVYQNGTAMSESDWAYNSDTNKVTITPVTSGVSLSDGDSIVITYNYYAKYSDTEIKSYIKSNLVHFTRRRYTKHFYMNSSDEVVTLNGINPTDAEGNIIAAITAIDIDPQNIVLKFPDFTISAAENKSKTQQINDVFDIYLRSFGKIQFIQDDEE